MKTERGPLKAKNKALLARAQTQHNPRNQTNREFKDGTFEVWKTHSLGKTEVPDVLRPPESLRHMSYFAHPENKDE